MIFRPLLLRVFSAAVALALFLPARGAAEKFTIELFPKGDTSKANPIVVSVNGEKYVAPVAVPDDPDKVSVSVPGLGFLASLVKIGKSGSLEEILQVWTPADRPNIKAIFASPAILEGNRKLYAGIQRSELLMRIDYGSTYSIFFVRHIQPARSFVKDYPALKSGDRYQLTNVLQEDPAFSMVSTRIAKSLDSPPENQKKQ
jgi:hypothetical protein